MLSKNGNGDEEDEEDDASPGFMGFNKTNDPGVFPDRVKECMSLMSKSAIATWQQKQQRVNVACPSFGAPLAHIEKVVYKGSFIRVDIQSTGVCKFSTVGSPQFSHCCGSGFKW